MGRTPAILIVFVSCWVASCGYSFRTSAGRLPDGSRALNVAVVEDRSTEAVAGAELSGLLRDEALRRDLRPAADAAVLKTRLLKVDARPRAVALAAGRFRAREQEVHVAASFELTTADGKQYRFQLTERRSYLSASDLRNTQANKRQALRQALESMAERALERIGRCF